MSWLIHFSFITLWLNNSTKHKKMVIPKWSQSLKRPTWIEKIKVQQLCMYISTEWWQFQLQIGKYNVYFPKHLHFQIHKSNSISFAHSFTKKRLIDTSFYLSKWPILLNFPSKLFSKTAFERLPFEFLSGHFVLPKLNDSKNNNLSSGKTFALE